MSIIRNGIVQMDWDSEMFFESKSSGTFVAAMQKYESDRGEFPVIFINRKAVALIGEDGELMGRDEFANLLSKLVRKYGAEEDLDLEDLDETYNICFEVSNGVGFGQYFLENFNLSAEDQQDIINRVEDIGRYYIEEVEDM